MSSRIMLHVTKVWNFIAEPGDYKIRSVVEPFISMTYYDIKYDNQALVECRATFTSNKILTTLRNTTSSVVSDLQPSITTVGEFRPLITINSHMPSPTTQLPGKARGCR